MSGWLSFLWGVLLFVVRRWRSPIAVEVRYLCYDDVRDSPVVIARSHLRQYHARLHLVNLSARTVYLDSIRIAVGTPSVWREARIGKGIHLKAHEPHDDTVIFPLHNDDAPVKTGVFTVEVRPTVGRATCTSGQFPLNQKG